MGKVLTHMTMSLDGFIADPGDQPGELSDRYEVGEVSVPSGNETVTIEVDEICVSLVPVLFGTGISYFSPLDRGHLLLEDPVVVQGHRALRLTYAVRR